jgi:steroid 5-alpha reductase family enzyme
MDQLVTPFVLSLFSAVAFLSLVFVYGQTKKRYDIIDTAWGPAFIVIAFVNVALSGHVSWAAWLTVGLVTVWGMRLAWHIFRRFLHASSEDARYTELRKKWPQKYVGLQVFLRIYLVQALLATLVSLPVIVTIHSPAPQPWVALVGGLVWIVGFVIESAADRQLKQFLAQPANKGKLMMSGLWNYSRHPNYFGEMTQWWGIGIIGFGASLMLSALVGPLIITLLIRFVSGVPPAERRAATKPEWEDYKKKTRMLVPLPR